MPLPRPNPTQPQNTPTPIRMPDPGNPLIVPRPVPWPNAPGPMPAGPNGPLIPGGPRRG